MTRLRKSMGRFRNRTATAKPFDFLDLVPELLRDHERRHSEGNRANRVRPPEQPKRIAALIADLDQVIGAQMGPTGGVLLGQDEIVQRLIREGEPAVPQLIECLKSDERLTRAVEFGRLGPRCRSVVSVRRAAFVALTGILHESSFGLDLSGSDLSEEERRLATTKAVREYWRTYRHLPLEERWFAVLADDNLEPRRWIEAAERIVYPADVAETTPAADTGGGGWGPLVPLRQRGEHPPLRGEVLRKKSHPSVGELMAKRLRDRRSCRRR